MVLSSPLWAFLLLPWWWLMGGSRAVGLLRFLVAGGHTIVLDVREDGALFVSEAGGPALYGHWTDIEDQGETWVISGGDGRFRLVVPKAALGVADRSIVRDRLGVELAALAPGQRARITRVGSRASPGG